MLESGMCWQKKMFTFETNLNNIILTNNII